MGINEFMNKVRQWDYQTQQRIIRNCYVLFFEAILVIIFIAVFINTLKIMNVNFDLNHTPNVTLTDRILMTQSLNSLFIVILLLFNSFWILYIFSSLQRLRSLLKNIDFNLSKRRSDQRPNKDDF